MNSLSINMLRLIEHQNAEITKNIAKQLEIGEHITDFFFVNRWAKISKNFENHPNMLKKLNMDGKKESAENRHPILKQSASS